MDEKKMNKRRTPAKKSVIFSDDVNAEIRRAATTGIYSIRGGGTKRALPHFDDLVFLALLCRDILLRATGSGVILKLSWNQIRKNSN